MPKPLQRACLEQGLRLDLNWLVRNGLVRPGEWMPELKFSWKLDRTDREPSLGLLTSNMEGNEGHLRIQIGKIDQIIKLAANERHLVASGSISFVRFYKNGARSFGNRLEPVDLLVALLGSSKQPTPRNSKPFVTVPFQQRCELETGLGGQTGSP